MGMEGGREFWRSWCSRFFFFFFVFYHVYNRPCLGSEEPPPPSLWCPLMSFCVASSSQVFHSRRYTDILSDISSYIINCKFLSLSDLSNIKTSLETSRRRRRRRKRGRRRGLLRCAKNGDHHQHHILTKLRKKNPGKIVVYKTHLLLCILNSLVIILLFFLFWTVELTTRFCEVFASFRKFSTVF